MHTVLTRKIAKSLLGGAAKIAQVASFAILLPFFLPLESASAGDNVTSAPAILSSNRFLFVIDTSAFMRREVDDVRAAINEVLQSAANGQLHSGDSIGVWTFNQDLHTGLLPLQVWKPEDAVEINLRLLEFVHQQNFEKTSRLDLAISAINKIVKVSDLVTIFIISDGKSPIQGTPFDNDINLLYLQSVHEMKGKSRAVVTVLQGKAGKYTSHYIVSARPWPIAVPALPLSLNSSAGQTITTPAFEPLVAATQPGSNTSTSKPKAAPGSTSLVLVGPQSTPRRPPVVIPPSDNLQPSQAPESSPADLPTSQLPRHLAQPSPVIPVVSSVPSPGSMPPIDPAAFNNPNPPSPPAEFAGKVQTSAPPTTNDPAQASSSPISLTPPSADMPKPAPVQISASSSAPKAVAPAATQTPSLKSKFLSQVGGLFHSLGKIRGTSLLSGVLVLLVLAATILLIMVRRANAPARISLISQTLSQGRN